MEEPRHILTKDFNEIHADMKAIGMNLYDVKYPKIKIDNDLGEQLRDFFFTTLLVMNGDEVKDAKAKTAKTSPAFKSQNTGRSFNFWHYVRDQIGKFETRSDEHYGECIIKRGMADPNEKEDLIHMFCYPYVAKGGKFAAPVVEKILDHYGVDEMKITATVDR